MTSSRFRKVAAAALFTVCVLAGCQHAPAASLRAGALDLNPAAWPDECAALPGYTHFVGELRSAVVRRDATQLRRLFAANGRMRMNGIGGDQNYPDWGLDRPAAADIWPELEEILQLGCAASGDRLYLPFIAAPGKGAGDDGLIALEDTAIRTLPAPAARILRLTPRGSVLQSLGGADADGWAHVATSEGIEGYVPSAAVRSPSSTALVLALEEGRWRIRWLGGNL